MHENGGRLGSMRRLMQRWMALKLEGRHDRAFVQFVDQTPGAYTRTTRATCFLRGKLRGKWQVDQLHPFAFPTTGRLHWDLLDALQDWGVGGAMGMLMAKVTCALGSTKYRSRSGCARAVRERDFRALAVVPGLVERFWLFE